jgi:sulfite exporter TauE/SafE/copper chaperone CopZ
MNLKRETLFVDGMTCPACEARVARALLGVPGVARAEARLKGGSVELEYYPDLAGRPQFEAALAKAGYALRGRSAAGTAVPIGVGLLLAAAYLLASAAGVFSVLPAVDAGIGYAMLFVVGLFTSVHCVAMCGGIALSQSLAKAFGGADAPAPAGAPAGGPAGAPAEADGLWRGVAGRFLPGLSYNAGRVLAYTAIGALVGAAGAAFSFSAPVKGAIAAAAGLLMVAFGLRSLGLVKNLPKLPFAAPAPFARAGARLTAWLRGRGPFAVGLLNGLMPCGPLQTMQLYALGTGSALAGGAAMLVFALGTSPLLLTFGAAAALLPRRFAPALAKASAVLVLFLGTVTFARAAGLAGIPLPAVIALPPAASVSPAAAAPSAATAPLAPIAPSAATAVPVVGDAKPKPAAAQPLKAVVSGGVQTVATEFSGGYYVPFTVQAGVPLKWTIRVTAAELNGCNNPLQVPAYGIEKRLVPGDNLIEFTPKKPGLIAYNCWMGMVRSRITVVADLSAAARSAGGGQ